MPQNHEKYSSASTIQRRLRTWIVGGATVVGIALVCGEFTARWGLGIGTPTLSVAHPTIEYMFRPDQNVSIFGNRQKYNAYGMRATDFPRTKSDPSELRVLVIGDSVINGGNPTDQAELGTELLKSALQELHDGPVVVGHVSAGSWGPMNARAYLHEFGWFDADALVMVWSDHDAWDVPTYAPLNPLTHPTDRPVSALVQGLTRYLPKLYKRYFASATAPPVEMLELPEPKRPQDESADAVLAIFAEAASREIPVALLLHRTSGTLDKTQPPVGEQWFIDLAASADVSVVQLASRFRAAIADGASPYRDNIHPSPAGQALLAEAMLASLIELRLVNAPAHD